MFSYRSGQFGTPGVPNVPNVNKITSPAVGSNRAEHLSRDLFSGSIPVAPKTPSLDALQQALADVSLSSLDELPAAAEVSSVSNSANWTGGLFS